MLSTVPRAEVHDTRRDVAHERGGAAAVWVRPTVTFDERVALAGRHALPLLSISPRAGSNLVRATFRDWEGGPELPALLPPGMWAISCSRFRTIAVEPFPVSGRRLRLMVSFDRFFSTLGQSGVAIEVWVGGSFLVDKLDPADMDLLVVLSPERFEALRPEVQAEVYETLLDQGALIS